MLKSSTFYKRLPFHSDLSFSKNPRRRVGKSGNASESHIYEPRPHPTLPTKLIIHIEQKVKHQPDVVESSGTRTKARPADTSNEDYLTGRHGVKLLPEGIWGLPKRLLRNDRGAFSRNRHGVILSQEFKCFLTKIFQQEAGRCSWFAFLRNSGVGEWRRRGGALIPRFAILQLTVALDHLPVHTMM